jgi:hypothetical protein
LKKTIGSRVIPEVLMHIQHTKDEAKIDKLCPSGQMKISASREGEMSLECYGLSVLGQSRPL